MKQMISRQPGVFRRIGRFYLDGFRSMTLGLTLWKVIIIKLIIIFGVLKLFFFPDFLGTKFSTDQQRADVKVHQHAFFARSGRPAYRVYSLVDLPARISRAGQLLQAAWAASLVAHGELIRADYVIKQMTQPVQRTNRTQGRMLL